MAVLKVEAAIRGKLRDLTYESGYYCAALHTYLGKYRYVWLWCSFWSRVVDTCGWTDMNFRFLTTLEHRQCFTSEDFKGYIKKGIKLEASSFVYVYMYMTSMHHHHHDHPQISE